MATVWTILVTVAIAALAIVAAVHAIMTRREVGTAVAWVGVILLSPVIGAVLYFLLGVNRIKRRARERRGDGEIRFDEVLPPGVERTRLLERVGPGREHLVHIAELGDRVVERPLLADNRIQALPGGDQAFPAMLDAIDQAQTSITLQSYIFDNDRAGERFLEALVAARDRGVEVRVLIDDVGLHYSFPPIIRLLRREGIPTGRFMPALLHWRMPYFNLRNHRKILVVDGRVGFTGGMNIREQYWTALIGAHHGDDLHFRVDGPVVAEMQESFAQDWYFTTGEQLAGETWFHRLDGRGDSFARAISDGPDLDFEKLHTLILGAISVAQYDVTIVTPYFIPDQRLSTILAITARRGVDVTIILPERVNLVLVQWASRAYWAELIEAGCRIVVTPPPFDHTKLMVVDGAWSLIGSANLDPRSLQLNFEFNLECYDPAVATMLDDLVTARRRIGREVSLDEVLSRPFHLRFRDRLARLLSPYL